MKVVLICASDGKGWKSCLRAERDLQSLYKKAFPRKVHSIYLQDPRRYDDIESDSQYILSVAAKVCRLKPTHIVFLSHRLHSAPILSALDHLRFVQAAYIFHIYGNWPIRLPRWRKSQSYIIGRRVQFLTNSTAFQKTVSAPMKNGSELVKVLPLTIDRELFRFSKTNRIAFRKQLDISADEVVALYAGRLSRAKGLSIFVRSILEVFGREPNTRLRVIVCGSYGEDDESSMRPLLDELSRVAGSQFTFLGELNQRELARVYSASDIFVSPSYYEYEAFGFAPVEALTNGLLCVLTDWLGYADLARASEPIRWLPAPRKNKSIESNEIDCQRALTRTLRAILKSRPFKSDHARRQSFNISEMYSHSAQIKRLRELLNTSRWPSFRGFKATSGNWPASLAGNTLQQN